MRKLLQLVLPPHLVRLFRKHKPILQLLIWKWEKPKRQHWKTQKIKGQPRTRGHIQLKKNHGIQFQSGPYGNESSCSNLIKAIWIIFQKDIYKKLLRVNFTSILCDGSPDTSINEQELVYIFLLIQTPWNLNWPFLNV